MALVCAAGSAPPAHEWHQGSLLATRVIAARLRFISLIAMEANEVPVLPLGEALPFGGASPPSNANLNSGGATR